MTLLQGTTLPFFSCVKIGFRLDNEESEMSDKSARITEHLILQLDEGGDLEHVRQKYGVVLPPDNTKPIVSFEINQAQQYRLESRTFNLRNEEDQVIALIFNAENPQYQHLLMAITLIEIYGMDIPNSVSIQMAQPRQNDKGLVITVQGNGIHYDFVEVKEFKLILLGIRMAHA